MNLTKVISTRYDSLNRRIVKFLRFGRSDVQECQQAAPFGIDSNPVKDMIAVYSPTAEDGKNVIIGYLNPNQLAEVGETRLFSTDSDGNLQFYVHLKNDGTSEIGGDTDNMVRYSELESAFNQLRDDLNDLISAYNSHIHTTTATIGASTTPGVIAPTTSTGTPSTADVSGAKIDEIKTI
jgi:hypothetical protein